MADDGSRQVAVALGGGGARGIAHIVVIEALDELGVSPAAIAGTSMGAIIGAAWAAGMRGRDIRQHVLALARDRGGFMRRLLSARVGRFTDMLGGKLSNPMLLDGERLLDLCWPQAVPDYFDELKLPFIAVATDYYGRSAVAFSEGPLVPAVAASIAIPGLVRPVEIGGKLHFDGGITDPLPFRHLMDRGYFVAACEVTGGPLRKEDEKPGAIGALLGASQILQGALTREILKATPPDLLLRPSVDQFRLLDFGKADEILAAAAPLKHELKRAVGTYLDAY